MFLVFEFIKKYSFLVGITLFISFPFLGNVFSTILSGNRRYLQASLLLLGCILISYHSLHLLRKHRAQLAALFRKKTVFIPILFLLIYPLFLYYSNGKNLTPFSVQKWFFVFTFFLGALLLITAVEKYHLLKKRKQPFTYVSNIPTIISLFTVNYVSALTAWYVGPSPLQAFISFNGSTTTSGFYASFLFCTSFFLLKRPFNFLASIPALYILLLATSRTGYICFLLFSISFIIVLNGGDKLKRFAGLLLAMAIVIAPLFSPSHIYPYFVRGNEVQKISVRNKVISSGSNGIVNYRAEELINRLVRLPRAMISLYMLTVNKELCAADSWVKNLCIFAPKLSEFALMELDYHDGNMRWNKLRHLAFTPDSRVDLIKDSIDLVFKNSIGNWPRSYAEKSSTYCNHRKKCNYPHNLILEISFYFGVIVGAVSFPIIILLSFYLLKISVFETSTETRLMSIGALHLIIAFQFAGTFYDYAVLIVLLPLILLKLIDKYHKQII
ncbi:O-antigen ligase family protein [Bdellovibrionales bacterium]|nr:O-antigen ligase family protein [Bdellovibrionales bacterium]